ncbi:MAG: hypothetical protein M1817_001554 [Caeruleum heppii]|nr:MAG: hypothetical protein M1817_001554 [Caeruleum heppii]
MQDDLEALFARNLTLSNKDAFYPHPIQPQPPPTEQPLTYSISQHYHHSAHLAMVHSTDSPAVTDRAAAEIILARNGVDPSSLYPSQMDLFQQANVEQQMRLVELWRFSRAPAATPVSAFDWTTAAQGGSSRWAQEQSPGYGFNWLTNAAVRVGETQEQTTTTDLLGSPPQDTRSPSVSLSGEEFTSPGDTHSPSAEPYILSGYNASTLSPSQQTSFSSRETYSPLGTAVGLERSASEPQYTQATDPVYRGPGSDPSWDKLVGQPVAEHQMDVTYQQLRQLEVAQDGVVIVHGSEDEEML